MNTLRTGHGALEMDNRERYRDLLIASQTPRSRNVTGWPCPRCASNNGSWKTTCWNCGFLRPGFIQHSGKIVEMAELVVFAGGMLALLSYGLMWILG